ncbi:ribonuclease domain-containing protein [Ferriphaselus sp. R-1]|uniref:ribonuclease domain-containing protein n=1 Tax=Ferriphaselus sp. R-1 TaxID=1485544 RepID=UPI000555D670|nr:ribonuclease domain-containing protein [Ferriphaselus sp. R-1]
MRLPTRLLLLLTLSGLSVFVALSFPARAFDLFSVGRPHAAVAHTLPPEAYETLRLIRQGGPFPYPRDGVVFGNRERRLPAQARGYYHEYTVKTPGEHGRGARRIVCGERQDCYYSGDHYQTFQPIEGQP